MNILRHLYLSTAVRAPDDPAVPEPEAIEAPPAPETSALVVGDPPAPEPGAIEGDPPSPEPEPAPAAPAVRPPAMVSLRVLQQRVGEETTKRQAIERRATDAERRAADLQAIIDRMQVERDPAATPRAAAAPRAEAPQETDFDTAVNAKAQQLRFLDDTQTVLAAGKAKFPDFQETCAVLTALGATNDEIVADLIAVDKDAAHEILDSLAKDPDRAASLVAMDSRRRIVELTRMSDTIKAAAAPKSPAAAEAPPAKAAASRAPAPAPRIAPQAPAPVVDPTTADGNDKMSDAQFEQWYKTKYYKRS